VRALFLEEQGDKVLWLHCDLIGLTNKFATSLKENLTDDDGLTANQVVVSATHTHSGPATIPLRYCGQVDEGYVAQLRRCMLDAARAAMANPEPVDLYFAEGSCNLTRDRRSGSSYQHVDNRLPVLAFRKEDGSYLALLANYAMHNVSLSSENRLISGDIAGIAAQHASLNLPGEPITLLTNGGCANTVPLDASADPNILLSFGNRIGDLIIEITQEGKKCTQQGLASMIEWIDLPLDLLSREDVLTEYQQEAARYEGKTVWLRAIKDWKHNTLELLQNDPPVSIPIVLQVIRIGPVAFTAIGAEVFSHLGGELRAVYGPGNYLVGYANGNIGYLPFRDVYHEGGYEVETAYKFYGNFMVSPGGYEQVRDRAIKLLDTGRGDEPQPQDFTPEFVGIDP
jgi:hypothetical protein